MNCCPYCGRCPYCGGSPWKIRLYYPWPKLNVYGPTTYPDPPPAFSVGSAISEARGLLAA